MKKEILAVASALILIFAFSTITRAETACTTIQSGSLFAGDNTVLTPGFDNWGYNYIAHEFNGGYCDAYHNDAWCQPWKNDNLLMKWNDAWLSSADCDGDGQLDRHKGFTSYRGSGAWVTNHQSGVYVDLNGKKQRWSYFVKIVAAPMDASVKDGFYYIWDANAQQEVALGRVLWGEFAVVMEVYNDTGDPKTHGILYKSPLTSGFGAYGPKQ